MTQFHYTCYGIGITSEIPCPELVESNPDTEATIKINEGQTPQELEAPTRIAARFSLAPQQLLLSIDSVARFWVRNGNRITFERAPGASLNDVRVFLYGTAIGAALLQQGHLPLHATTVTKGKHAIAFAGPSGAGKSTLAHTLLQRGWKLVCDDISVLTLIDGELRVQPAYPSIKLWNDVLEASNTDISKLHKIRTDFDKYRWTAKEQFHATPVPLTAIIGLLPIDREKIQVETLKGANKFKYLVQQTYRHQMIKDMANSASIFGAWSQTLEHVPLWSIQRPQSPMDPLPLADAVEELFK